MSFEGFLNQVFQPYFYYSVIFLTVTFVCVKILTKYCSFIGQRTKSLLYVLPLTLPLAVMLVAFPSTVIKTSYLIGSQGIIGRAASTFPFNPFMQSPAQIGSITIFTTSVLSVTGILCIVGLIAGGLFAASMVLADDRLARRVLHVISLSPEEHQWLQTNVAESSKKLGITPPKIGLIEDLRPNAFTIGYGKKATIVFSIGLLNILNKEEVIAVASHELAHVKNNDFFFKIVSNALTAVSFFNPVSYIASSAAQREREMLADERAIELTEKPSVLGDALAKICKAIQDMPKESLRVSFSSNLLVGSSVLHRVGILSTHPRLDARLRNISAPKPHKRWSRWNINFTVLLSIMLILSAVVVGLATADLQANFTVGFTNIQHNNIASQFKLTANDVGYANCTVVPSVFSPPFNGTQQNLHMLIYQPQLQAGGVANNAEASNVSFVMGREIPAGSIILVHPQFYGYDANQSAGNPAGPMWIG